MRGPWWRLARSLSEGVGEVEDGGGMMEGGTRGEGEVKLEKLILSCGDGGQQTAIHSRIRIKREN